MLVSLRIRNLALIKEAQLHFAPGMNVLSGESGTGKTMLVKALALLQGQKADFFDAKEGANKQTLIEAFWDLHDQSPLLSKLKEQHLEVEENQLVVRRVFSATGKSRTYMNGSPVPLTFLREILFYAGAEGQPPLMEITQQGKSFELLSTAFHLHILDHFCGLEKEVLSYKKSYDQWHQQVKKLQKQEEQENYHKRELSFLKYQTKRN